MQVNYNLVNFVRAIVERLMLSSTFNQAELTSLLASVRGSLATLHEQYSMPAPEGAEITRDLLLEAIELYDSSLEHVLEYVQDRDQSHLLSAVYLAEEAADVILAVEDVVATNKQFLADMVAA